MRWGIDSFIPELQSKQATAYLPLPLSFKTSSLKERIAMLTATLNHNKKVLQKYLYTIKTYPVNRRMYRIPNLCFPLYFNRYFAWMYKDLDYKQYFLDVGNFCRKNKIRISIHSDMNVYLGLESDYNYFALNAMGKLFREMGYDSPYQNGTCYCVHSTFKYLPPDIISTKLKENVDLSNLSFCAVENTHTKNSLYENLEIDGIAKIVDLHHHLIANQKYLSPNSKLWLIVKNSWKKQTPKIHLSVPQQDTAKVDGDFIKNEKKILEDLIPAEFYDSSYIKHSDFIWGKRYLNWARKFDADVMIESAWCASATKMAANNITCIEELEATAIKSKK